jgi:predicted polyphosphate/ATP-dependent NAD kinase
MALTKLGFIVTGSDLATRMIMRSPTFEMIAVGVRSPAEGPDIARGLIEEGVQLIELCGGFGPLWTSKIIDAIGAKVPVGSVSYGPEAIEGLHAIFGPQA